MFKKFANKLFQKPIEPVEPELEEVEESKYKVSFTYDEENGVFINVSTLDDNDINVQQLAELVTYIGSITGQMDLLDLLRQGLDDGTDKYDRFIGHFLTLKTQEITVSNETTGVNDPCISPLEML